MLMMAAPASTTSQGFRLTVAIRMEGLSRKGADEERMLNLTTWRAQAQVNHDGGAGQHHQPGFSIDSSNTHGRPIS
ncbi:hypothetical protein Hsero_1275 [Herbaspirillum seropedicae SmR1]|uniref:Uncharacterized protein n=1 Tax=Herbaspirillum seropedicae (strain SmR1) TaxID=757424 RepID=D8INX1_HERSS|nr:hypothetical protein Hsero_1275 [Herbaspirillum seropedicae SmR1]